MSTQWPYLACLALLLSASAVRAEPAVRFRPIEVYIDATPVPLAAYQIEIVADGEAEIVGVEGGDAPAFAEPPRYDPKALTGKRIILAAFDTGTGLPHGRTRVATVHVREAGPTPPDYTATLVAAAGADGRSIPAIVELVADKGVDQ